MCRLRSAWLLPLILSACNLTPPAAPSTSSHVKTLANLESNDATISSVNDGILLYSEPQPSRGGARLVKLDLSSDEISEVYSDSVPVKGAWDVNGTIYFALHGINAVDDDAERPTVLSPTVRAAQLCADNTYAYWVSLPDNYGTSSLYKVYRQLMAVNYDSKAEALLDGRSFDSAVITLDGGFLYVTAIDYAGSTLNVFEVNADTLRYRALGTIPIARQYRDACRLFSVGSRLYVFYGGNQLFRVDKASGDVAQVFSGLVRFLTADGTSLFWLGVDNCIYQDDGITAGPMIPSLTSQLASLNYGDDITWFSQTADRFLFLTDDWDGDAVSKVYDLPKAGGAVELAATIPCSFPACWEDTETGLYLKANGSLPMLFDKLDYSTQTLALELPYGVYLDPPTPFTVNDKYYLLVSSTGPYGHLVKVPRRAAPVPELVSTAAPSPVTDIDYDNNEFLWCADVNGESRVYRASTSFDTYTTIAAFSGDPAVNATGEFADRAFLLTDYLLVTTCDSSWNGRRLLYSRATNEKVGDITGILPDSESILAAASSGDSIYVAAASGIYSFDIGTGATHHLMSGSWAEDLAVMNGRLYWVNGEGLFRMGMDGSGAEKLYGGVCNSLVADGSSLYIVADCSLLQVTPR